MFRKSIVFTFFILYYIILYYIILYYILYYIKYYIIFYITLNIILYYIILYYIILYYSILYYIILYYIILYIYIYTLFWLLVHGSNLIFVPLRPVPFSPGSQFSTLRCFFFSERWMDHDSIWPQPPAAFGAPGMKVWCPFFMTLLFSGKVSWRFFAWNLGRPKMEKMGKAPVKEGAKHWAFARSGFFCRGPHGKKSALLREVDSVKKTWPVPSESPFYKKKYSTGHWPV